ncbi:hypothetical protein Pfo_016901 [Paulownia fortunei]|nr:hypothetical protein Pfo_016901 [Paulownia fortunei]
MAGKNPYPPCVSFPCRDRECCGQGKYKTMWPNLIGFGAEEAKTIIVQDNPLVTVVPVRIGQPIIDNFCCNRVRLIIDEKNHVVHVPVVG